MLRYGSICAGGGEGGGARRQHYKLEDLSAARGWSAPSKVHMYAYTCITYTYALTLIDKTRHPAHIIHTSQPFLGYGSAIHYI